MNAPEFVSLSLDQIRPSSGNPRKTFDEDGLKQLAASIREKGVLEPILVRPRTLWQRVCSFVRVQKAKLDRDGSDYGLSKGQFESAGIKFAKGQYDTVIESLLNSGRAERSSGLILSYEPGPNAIEPVTDNDPLGLGIDHYQLIAGERRWRASAIAGVETIPALVRDLTDKEAAEVAVIENDQREDVAPLEQAEGYAALIAMGDDVESIAAKIGRPAKYVTARLTLTKLIPALQEDLRSGKLPFGHAHLLARLPAAQQEAVLSDDNGGLWDYDGVIVPLDQLKRELRRDFIGLLNDAPWDLADESLVPAAGSCTKCPKRSGANPTLFDELVRDDSIDLNKKLKPKDLNPDHCTDRACYAAKKTAFIELQLRKAEEKSGTAPAKVSDTYYSTRTEGVLGKDRYEVVPAKEAKNDPKAKVAVVTDGENIGKTIYIREKKPSTGRANDSYAKQERERRERAKIENAARITALGLIADATNVAKLSIAHLPQLACAMAAIASGEVCKQVADRRGLPAAKQSYEQVKRITTYATDPDITAASLHSLVAELIAGKFSQFNWTDPDEKAFWAAFGIDRKALVKAAENKLAEENPAPKAKPAKKRKAGAA